MKIKKTKLFCSIFISLFYIPVNTHAVETQVKETSAKEALSEKQALYQLGYQMQKGDGMPKNLPKAIESYKKASALGHRSANHNLGMIYYLGEGGIKQDYVESAKWFAIGAERDLTDSQKALVHLYHQQVIPRDNEKLKSLYLKLIQKGRDEYQIDLANLYYFDEKNYKDAEPLYLDLASKGNTDIYQRLGSIYFKGIDGKKDYAKAFNWFKKDAENGNNDSQLMVGLLLLDGLGVNQNTDLALNWFDRAAKQGNQKAIEYVNALTDETDVKKIHKLSLDAAQNGDAKAQYNLGVNYEYGFGVEQDMNQAFSWYKKAADQGEPFAQVNLANMYFNELCACTPKNTSLAISLYKKAASQNNAQAQFNLGQIYYHGWGVKKDIGLAKTWYQSAYKNGYLGANDMLKQIDNDK